jgi:type VI secretion system secreted protein Hcp
MGLVLLVAVFAVPRSSLAGQNDTAYLQIEGVPGASTEKVHPGWIELTSWSWSTEKGPGTVVEKSGAGMEKTGAGARKTRPGEMKVAMKADAQTRILEKSAATGQVFPKVVLEVLTTKPNQPGQVFLTIKMEDVVVSSFAMAEGGAAMKGMPQARAAFSYAKVEIVYAPQKPDGTKGAVSPAETSWDLKSAQKI